MPENPPTNESDGSRTRLLQLMADKLYSGMKCKEVYTSPRCFTGEPILERDSAVSDRLISAIKGCNVSITDLTKRLYYARKPVRLAIIDMLGFPHLRMIFDCFSTHTSISKKLPLVMVEQLKSWLDTNYWRRTMMRNSIVVLDLFNKRNKKYVIVSVGSFHFWYHPPTFGPALIDCI